MLPMSGVRTLSCMHVCVQTISDERNRKRFYCKAWAHFMRLNENAAKCNKCKTVVVNKGRKCSSALAKRPTLAVFPFQCRKGNVLKIHLPPSRCVTRRYKNKPVVVNRRRTAFFWNFNLKPHQGHVIFLLNQLEHKPAAGQKCPAALKHIYISIICSISLCSVSCASSSMRCCTHPECWWKKIDVVF